MTRVGIVGSRPPKPDAPAEDHALFARLIADVDRVVASLPPDTTVVSGGAYGVDKRAVRVAYERDLGTEEFFPGNEPSPQRFYLRNQRIIDNSERLIAFTTPWARGTWDSVRKAREAGVPVEIHSATYESVDVEVTAGSAP